MNRRCPHRPSPSATEKEYDRHAASCAICGKRVRGNLTGELRSEVRRVAWRMFAPLALAEALVTFAAVTALAPSSRMTSLLMLSVAIFSVLGFVLAHSALAIRLLRPEALDVIDDHFFLTPVVPPDDEQRYPRLQRFTLAYLRFAKFAGLASFLSYATAGLVAALLLQIPFIVPTFIAFGALWSVTFRTRLAAIQPIELLELDAEERAWLERVQRSASRMHRLLSRTHVLTIVTKLHAFALGVTAVITLAGNLIEMLRTHAAAVGTFAIGLALLSLLWFLEWSQALRSGTMEPCVLVTPTDEMAPQRCRL